MTPPPLSMFSTLIFLIEMNADQILESVDFFMNQMFVLISTLILLL